MVIQFATSRRLRHLLPMLGLVLAITMLVATRGEAALRPVEQITTPSGVKLWLVQEPSIPLVAIRFAMAGGALQDPDGKEGLASLLAGLLSEGGGDLELVSLCKPYRR